MNKACVYGDIDLVKKLGLPESPDAIYYASLFGYLELVKYLVSINAPIDQWAIRIASKYGHLDTVKYLISVNAPINEHAITCAAEQGHFEIVKYLLIQGAPYKSTDLIEKLKKEISEIIEPISEFIGPDITSIILQNLF